MRRAAAHGLGLPVTTEARAPARPPAERELHPPGAMADLAEYRRKRDFEATPEPGPELAPEEGRRFVVQKHGASRLHYDFRLEHDGVLWSWAVPKGPSLDPGHRRLAVRTEDHPVAYAAFEGVIPEGEYGGGPVQLWDRGSWRPLEDAAASLERGRLRFELHGERLRGRFTLVRTRRGDWLLIKGRDAHADEGEAITSREDTSVVSGRSLEEIAQAPDAVWRSDEGLDPAAIEGARRRSRVRPKPQLATRADGVPRGAAWIHELKIDGYRLLAHVRRGQVTLQTRSGLDWTAKAPALARRLAALPADEAWLDGELCVLDAAGVPDFGALQRALADGRDGALRWYAFDLLYLDGFDLRPAALTDRRAALRALVAPLEGGLVRLSEGFEDGEALFAEACALGGEGVVSKRRDAPYAGGRSRAWRKVKCTLEREAPIVGFTEPSGSRRGLGALVLGRWVEGELRYAGKVGTGFDAETRSALRARLEPLETDEAPVPDAPKRLRARWVRPEHVARVKVTEETREGRLRHASFVALAERDDPAPRVRLTTPRRVLYPDIGLEKRELAAYYEAVASRMLPLVADRPLMLVRCPDGVDAECFHQKHRPDGTPAALRPATVDDGEPHAAITTAEGLRALAQISALEVHLWGARASDVERPERVVFDLDPDEGLEWSAVVAAATEVRRLLEGVGLHPFCLHTGGKGVHVVAPLTPDAGWKRVKAFSRAVAETLASDAPDRYTATLSRSARGGKVFVDYLRNGRGATAIAPYSTRARPGAPVAAPIAWSELDRAAPRTLLEVLEAMDGDDPWAGYEDARRSLPT